MKEERKKEEWMKKKEEKKERKTWLELVVLGWGKVWSWSTVATARAERQEHGRRAVGLRVVLNYFSQQKLEKKYSSFHFLIKTQEVNVNKLLSSNLQTKSKFSNCVSIVYSLLRDELWPLLFRPPVSPVSSARGKSGVSIFICIHISLFSGTLTFER